MNEERLYAPARARMEANGEDGYQDNNRHVWRRVQYASKQRSPEMKAAEFWAFRAMVRDPMHHFRIEEEMRRIARMGNAYNEAARASGKPKWRATRFASEQLSRDGAISRIAGLPNEERMREPKMQNERKHWTNENIADLKRCYAGEITFKVLGERVGFGISTLHRKAKELGIERTAHPVRGRYIRPPWDEASLAALRECWAVRGSVCDLAETLGRSTYTCRRKASALGLARGK